MMAAGRNHRTAKIRAAARLPRTAVRAVLRDVRARVGNGVMVALDTVTERIER